MGRAPTDMSLSVSDDYALRSWILSFGSGVRVLAPASLVQWAMDELESSRRLYPDGERRPVDPSLQPALPFSLRRVPTA